MVHHLSADRIELIADPSVGGIGVLHLGAPLGDAFVAAAADAPVPEAGLDALAPIALLPEAGAGWGGVPGVSAHRGGRAVFPRCGAADLVAIDNRLTADAVDDAAGIAQRLEITVHDAGVIEVVAVITNTGPDDLTVDGVAVCVPAPHAGEVLTFGGRWSDEFHPVRTPWEWGAVAVENRSGRTSHTRFPLLVAGTPGFTDEAGIVTAIHVGWSGNAMVRADRLPDGRRVLQAGELLLPGEVVLAPDELYRSPPVFVAHAADGLNGIRGRFHDLLRSRPTHVDRPRPVLLNTWEAVYFQHDLTTLTALADRAAAVGVERFVLDDGWFRGRDHDRAGLGDWTVDQRKWPDGLGPLIDHVGALGMQFGLWVEPEMVNPDSDLFRAHPEWVLADRDHDPVLARHQLVLDLTEPGAYAHVHNALRALLDEYDIAYLKWDMNRDHVAPLDGAGRAATRRQTLALYRLLDDLRAAHPDVEIESCSSGGGRVDLGILARTDRIWTSDCNDALDRVRIQRGASLLVPPELMGAHVGPTRSHTTGRTHTVAFRGATALFGHLGVEWNLLAATDDELTGLRRVIDVHKQHRSLLHGGRTLMIDTLDPALSAFAVVAPDRAEALVSVSQIATSRGLPTGMLRVPGLDPDRIYRVESVALDDRRSGKAKRQPAWLGGAMVGGRQLGEVGLTLPILDPESALLVHLSSR